MLEKPEPFVRQCQILIYILSLENLVVKLAVCLFQGTYVEVRG
jgi:hypothetical protein